MFPRIEVRYLADRGPPGNRARSLAVYLSPARFLERRGQGVGRCRRAVKAARGPSADRGSTPRNSTGADVRHLGSYAWLAVRSACPLVVELVYTAGLGPAGRSPWGFESLPADHMRKPPAM